MKTRKEPKHRAPKFALRIGRGHAGHGLFAAEDIPRGRFVLEYVGPIIDDDEADRRGGRYLFNLENGWNIDGSPRSNVARYANHACKPNLEAWQDGNRIELWSRRRIRAGEELTFDYGKEYVDGFIAKGGCKCPAHPSATPAKKAR